MSNVFAQGQGKREDLKFSQFIVLASDMQIHGALSF